MVKRNPDIDRYLRLESDFTDFLHFQGDPVQRAEEKEAFIRDKTYVPRYTYPQLTRFTHDNDLTDLKRLLLEASFGLYEAHDTPQKALQLSYIHDELARMALVGAAASLHVFRSSAEYETASSAFKQYNCMAYGEYDKSKGGSLLKTEYERALNYQPRTSQASRIQRELLESFPASVTLDFDKELPLLPDEVLQAMHDEVWHRWGKELAIVPDTDETVLYNAEQCAYYLRESLQSDGLAGAGWVVEIRQDVIVPMTLPMKKRIYIPKNVLFSASSIRHFLIGHEQKVHAWRAENGDKSGDHMLKAGTPSSMGIEEGLGILSECAIEGSLDNPSFHRARDRYITAGLALGVDGRERDAREVYEIVWRMIALRQSPDGIIDEKSIDQSKQSAYAHIENAFRGTPFWRKGTIYSKLKVYYEELGANASYMMSFNGDLKTALDRAMIGKYNHTSVDERTLFLQS